MSKFKKLLAALSTVTIMSTLVVTTAHAATFPDVPSWAEDAVEYLVSVGAVDSSNSEFRSGESMNRAEAATLLGQAVGLEGDVPSSATFVDVPTSHWAYEWVERAFAAGVVSGYSHLPGYYGPGDTLTKGQWAKMVVEATGMTLSSCDSTIFDDVSSSNWECKYVTTLAEAGLVDTGNANFETNKNINRAEAAVMAFNGITATPGGDDDGDDDDDDSGDDDGDDDDTSFGGDLEVSVVEVDGATLPSGATSVEMVHWEFTAGDEPAKVESLTVSRFGVSDLPSSHSVYLYEGSDRLTSGKSVNSTTNVAVFNNLDLEVDANETRTVTLRLDVGTVTTTGEIGFEIESADDVDAGDSEVEGSFPLSGDTFGLSTTAAGTVTIEKNGTVSDPKVGEKDAEIAKFKISAATEAASLEEIGLYIQGTVDADDIENLELYVSGEDDPIATVDGPNSSDIAQFILDDAYVIEKGDTRSFWVTADFSTGRSSDTVLVYIDETTDVLAVGDKYGYGMAVDIDNASGYDGTTCTAAGAYADCTNSTLEGGDITIAGSSISNRNLAVNQDDVSILNFSITAEADVTFNNFAMYLDTGSLDASDPDGGLLEDSDSDGTKDSSDAANFTDIKIKEVGGNHVWGPIDSDELLNGSVTGTVITEANDAAAAYYLFTDDLVLDAGETKEFELTLDVENNADLATETITAAIFIDTSYPEVKDVNNKVLTNSSALVPTSTYIGDAFTVKANSLSIVRSSSVGSATEVVGSSDVPMAAFSVGAGDASSIEITDIQLTGYVDDGGASNLFVAGVDTVGFSEIVLGMDLYVGSVSEANKLNTSSRSADSVTGEINFNNLDWVIDAGETETLIVVGDLANNSSYNGDMVKVDVADVSADITAEDNKGNTISSTSADTPNGGTVDSESLYTQITISSGGSLSVDIPSGGPQSQIVVAGTNDNEFGELEFTASDESFVIDQLVLRNDQNLVDGVAGDYDDNIDTLTLRYFTDAAQTTEATTTCAAATTVGYWECSGMSMYVPDSDLTGVPDEAILTIEADLNGTSDSLADEGDKPAFTLSMVADFEATGVGSSTKVTENNLTVTDITGAGTDSTADLDVTLTSTATTLSTDVADLATNDEIAPGDFICVDVDDAAGSCAALEIMYVTAVDGDDLTVVRGVNGTTAAGYTAAGGDDSILIYDESSTLSTNYMQVQATDLVLATGTETRTGSTSTTEEIMELELTANSAKKAEIRQGYQEAAEDATDVTVDVLDGEFVGTDDLLAADSTTKVQGTNSLELAPESTTIENGSAAVYEFSTGDAADYSRVSFWLLWHDDAGSTALGASDLAFITDDDGDTVQAGPLYAGVNRSALTTAYSEDIWYFVDIAVPTGTADGDDYFGIEVTDATTVFDGNTGNYVLIDDIRFYNERINVDLSLNENWAAITPTLAYLKQGDTTVATTYLDLDAAVSSKTGQVLFVPVGTYGDIDITSSSEPFTVEIDTLTAISDDSTATEKLTATVDFGNVSTAGDIYWYDGASVLNFFGVNSTDRFQSVTSY